MGLIADLKELRDAVTADPFEINRAWKALKAVGDDVIGFIGGVGAISDEERAEVKACCDEILAECQPTVAGDGVSKFGDGKFIEFVMKVLPLILALL